jgi:hypothetical protein
MQDAVTVVASVNISVCVIVCIITCYPLRRVLEKYVFCLIMDNVQIVLELSFCLLSVKIVEGFTVIYHDSYFVCFAASRLRIYCCCSQFILRLLYVVDIVYKLQLINFALP